MQNKIITHINLAKGFRGGERQTLLLIKELSKQGYIQKVITRTNSELAKRLKDTKNLTIIKIHKPYFFNLKAIKDSSILHAHETKAAQFSYFSNLIYNIPYIITRRVDNPIKNNFFNKNIYTKATYTVPVSSVIKNETLKINDKINIKIIADAYSKLTINEDGVKKIKQKFQDKFLIGNIGELDNNHKGQYYLIEAMKKIQTNYPNIHLLFLGKGKDEQNYKKQSKDLRNISFEGFVNNVEDYIKCFDLFVFPSLHEGLGSILLDIMQMQVPIIATNVGGIPDIIHNNQNGILIEPKNSDAIYNAIVKLYKNKELRETLSKEAFKTKDNYSFEKMTNHYINIYTEIENKLIHE